MAEDHFERLRYSHLILIVSFIVVNVFLESLRVSAQLPRHNGDEIYHTNLTDCPGRIQTVSANFYELLDMAACSQQEFLAANHWVTPDSNVNVTSLASVYLANTKLESVVDNALCNLPNLEQQILKNNQFKDGDHLGFGTNCQPSDCGINLSMLNLDGNQLEAIKVDSFLCTMKNLGQLSVKNNNLQHIEVNAFANASKLSHLYFTNNSLTSLAPGTFSNLSNLWTLDVSFNKITRFNCFASDDLRGLGNLDLNDNEIDTLESGVFKGLKNMVYLTLANNRISEMADGTFDSLNQLDELRLEQNLLTRLSHDSLRGLGKLSSLVLSNNQIGDVQSGAFEHVQGLTYLSLQNNRLTEIPKFSRMVNLTQLLLANNFLTACANRSFVNVTGLKQLDLSYNQISVLEDLCFQGLTSLESLKLDHNQIVYRERLVNGYESLFSEIATETFRNNLVDLDLSHNRLGIFKFSIPIFMTNYALKRLNLSNNSLTLVKIDAQYEPILEIVKLDLSYNSIPVLNTSYVFLTNFPKFVDVINLSNNLIRYVDPSVLNRAEVLRHLKLSNNLLTSLDLSSVQPRSNGGRIGLELAANPWKCDCHLLWLRNLIVTPSSSFYVQDYSDLVCARQFHRFNDASVLLSQTNISTDFFCNFDSSKSVPHCPTTSGFQCSIACPDRCSCYRSSDWKSMIVDCHRLNLTAIPTTNVPELTTFLYLDENDIGKVDKLPHLPSLVILFLNSTGLKFIDAGAFSKVTSLRRLYLQHNLLADLPEGVFDNLTDLVELNLSNNRLSMPTFNMFLSLTSLESLQLNDNLLRTSPAWNLRELPALANIMLFDNPWSCDCSFVIEFTTWMSNESSKLVKSDQIYCLQHEDRYEPVQLNWFDKSVCFGSTSGMNSARIAILFSSLGAFALAFVIILALLFYRHEMQVLIYSRYGVRLFYRGDANHGDANKQYDAFVSYSSLDEDFVINQLIPGLEGIAKPYSLCLHHRDFPIGAFINESIFWSIDNSCRTIIVLSENFVHSEWCRFEFRTAHAQMLQDRKNRVIVIVLGKLPADADIGSELRLYLRTNTYLCWGDKLFWKKLYFVLPNRQEVAGQGIELSDQLVAEQEL